MKSIERIFVELVNRAINCNYEDDGFFDDVDWKELYDFAAVTAVFAICYDVVKNQHTVPENVRKAWDRHRFNVFVRQRKHYHMLMDVVNDIASAGMDYAVFKGVTIAATYPNPSYRPSSDSDILVSVSDRPAVSEIIESKGYKLDKLKSKEKVFVYCSEESGHVIELHTSVFEDFEGPQIDILREAGIENSDHRIVMDIDGDKVRTFGVSQHLVYQMFHLIKHFILEGAGLRFLTDITLFVNKNKDSIDKKYFWTWMDKCGYREFCENLLTICADTFGMDDSILERHRSRTDKSVLDAILVDFIYCGDEEKLRTKNWLLYDQMEQYLVGTTHEDKSMTFTEKVKFAFPEPDMLDDIYYYAKKNHFLLPVAWIHRGVRKVWWTLFEKKKEEENTAHRLESRLQLFDAVGLIDEVKD